MRFTKDQTEATSFMGALIKTNPHWCEDGFESGGCMALRLSSVPVVLHFSPIDCFEDDHSGSEASRDDFHRRVEDEL
ncbi:hypothetical protein K435DRAFT_781182 [Dendrothele bispora CBS 962.96]|uniref:Uncharacterized protein n=1 Tax=Dendrothele bispora (strain CBS 962.96) TaxID=1314807 RepID=A0A4S8LNS4_DENBC|nr:hypothetical protein K435DRAFT_781177 [Dendrothele bispora CBS 962.96]THU90601.1 hypothetical protein K435DRAFT_781182 [Dendrothele bispora CBS 962.96]